MEETWIADRSTLRHLLNLHPSWTHPQFADCLHRSLSWVKKWRKRFAQADPTDLTVVFGLSRARHTPLPAMDARIERAILDIRDQPPENLGRVPGPQAILSSLPRHAEFAHQNVHLPRSTRTIWQVLCRHDRILHAPHHKKQPLQRPEPRGARSRSMRTRCLHGRAGPQWRRQAPTRRRNFQLCGCRNLDPAGFLRPPGLPCRNRPGGAGAVLAGARGASHADFRSGSTLCGQLAHR
jgi:hypothetical protein